MDDVTLLCQLYADGKSTADRLRTAGFDMLEKISESPIRQLSAAADLSTSVTRKLIAAAAEMLNSANRTVNTELLGLEAESARPSEIFALGDPRKDQASLAKGITRDEVTALDELTISARPSETLAVGDPTSDPDSFLALGEPRMGQNSTKSDKAIPVSGKSEPADLGLPRVDKSEPPKSSRAATREVSIAAVPVRVIREKLIDLVARSIASRLGK